MATKDTIYASELLGRGQNADTIDGKHADYFVFVKNVTDEVTIDSHDLVGSARGVKIAYDKAMEALNRTIQVGDNTTELIYRSVIYKEAEFTIVPTDNCRTIVCSGSVRNVYLPSANYDSVDNGWNCTIANQSLVSLNLEIGAGANCLVNNSPRVKVEANTYITLYSDGTNWLALDSSGRIAE